MKPSKLQHCWDWLKYSEESWRLAVTQTPMKDHKLMLSWKTCKEQNNKNVCIVKSSSSCRATSTDLPDPLSSLIPIVHRSWIFKAISYIGTGSNRLFCLYHPCEGIHGSISFRSSSLLLQQCPTCLARLTLIVLVIGGRWLYSCYFVGCCLQDLFNIAHSIFMYSQVTLSNTNNLYCHIIFSNNTNNFHNDQFDL